MAIRLAVPRLGVPLKPRSSPFNRTEIAGRVSSRLLPGHGREVDNASRRLLMYFVVPAWLGAGLLDYLFHRRTQIERTAGLRESLIHALMMTEASVPTLMGLFLDVNAGVLLTTVLGLIAHELTAIWDVSYAEPRRRVTPAEQHVHSLLEVLPLTAATFTIALHWEQARALFGRGDRHPRFAPRWKRPGLSRGYVVSLLAALLLFGVVPYLEEFWRCYRAHPTLAPEPEPARPATETLRAPDGSGWRAEATAGTGSQ